MSRIIIFLATIIILTVSCEKANENPDPSQTHFEAQILKGYFVQSIAFDQQGNAWIGTFKQGLIKYNSNETKIYNSQNSIISDTSVINGIVVDSENNVWIASEGLIKYDGSEFTLYNSANTPMPVDYVRTLDINAQDHIWFSSSRFNQGGLVKFDGTNWTVFTPENSDLPANLIQSLAIDHNDDVWLALNEVVNDAYLVKISDDNWNVYTPTNLGFTPYYFGNIQVTSQNILCGAINYALSSKSIHDGPQVFLFDSHNAKQLQFDNTTNIGVIAVDNQDHIWCAIPGGYAVFDGENWNLNNTVLTNNSIFAITQAHDNKLWLGTGDGIYILDR